MKLQRFKAVARKEFLHVWRDSRSLAMAIAMPMILLLLFGYALTLDVDRVPLAVWDQSGTSASREFISRFAGSRYFSLRAYVKNYREVERAVDHREALVALIIPRDFAGKVASGRVAEAQMIVDGSDSNTATIAMGYATAVTQGYSQDVSLREIRHRGGRPPEAPIELRSRMWFNNDMQSRNYIIPGLIAVIMMIIAALLTSLTVAREWERGTMEQLISTPVKGPELVLGKLAPYFVIGIVDVVLAVLMGEYLFRVPLRGSVVLLFIMTAIFLVGALGMGMVISIVAKNQLVANQLAMVLTFLPAFILSGLIYAISNMPSVVQVITYLVPARYLVSLLKGIYMKGVGVRILAGDVFLLVLFAVAMIVLANVRFKKKLV